MAHKAHTTQYIPSIKPGNYRHHAPITIADHLTIQQKHKLNIPKQTNPDHKITEQYTIHGIPPVKIVPEGREPCPGNYFTWIDEFDGQPLDAFFPFDGNVDEFEIKMADLRIAPDLAHDYKWDCSVCSSIQFAPKTLLMSAKDSEIKDCKPDICHCQNCIQHGIINHKFTTTIPCSQCSHRGLAIIECQYPDCWWKMFCRTDAKLPSPFCSYHKDHDPSNIKDILQQCVSSIENDGSCTYWGGQAFLNQDILIDDYDFEYYQFLQTIQ